MSSQTMERATRKVFRAWEDFEVFDAIDKPISVGNFDEGDGEEVTAPFSTRGSAMRPY